MRARAWLSPYLLVAGCAKPAPAPASSVAAHLVVTSPAFAAQGAIPRKHTCPGDDLSPALDIAGIPPSAKTLALIMDDPDAPDPAAPKHVWVHWVAYDLPASTTKLAEGAGNGASLGRPGKNDWGTTGYRGPCPPIGRHRYFVKVLALDAELAKLGEPNKAALLAAAQGHIVAQGELLGTYEKATDEQAK